MKKLFLFALLCLMALSMNAQRCAVLEFKAGAGISQADVNGISAIFITYFRSSGYTMVERTQIDKVISEQRFQQGALTENQMVKIGRILNVSKIVVGDVNMVMGEYNVDVRVVDVQSGAITTTEGASFAGSSYRASMQELSQKLSSKIAIAPVPSGYVDLGLPSGKYWKKKNEEGLYDYAEATDKFGKQLPSKEDWEELIEFCDWVWTGDGYKVIGKDLRYIILPYSPYVENFVDDTGKYIRLEDIYTRYMSNDLGCCIRFNKNTIKVYNSLIGDKILVRLIH